jgi:hypothetical protein
MASQLLEDYPGDAVLQISPATADAAALLITSLRGVPFAVPENTDWERLLDLAQANGVLLHALPPLLENGAEVPGFFTNAARQSRVSAQRHATELEILLSGFAQHSIEVLPLKGPALSLALYNDEALRSSVDLDLLVRRDDFLRAEALLLDCGFVAVGPRSDHDRGFRRGDLIVELHYDLDQRQFRAFDVREVWRRSRCGDFRGKHIRLMSGEDLVLYLCLHGFKHGFSRLAWILDLAQALNRVTDRDCESIWLHARRTHLLSWLIIGCEVVRAMFPFHLPEAMDRMISSSPRQAARARAVVAHIFSEDPHESLNGHQRYLAAEGSIIRRWRYRFRCLVPSPRDYHQARRDGAKPELLFFLKPLRIVKERGLSKLYRTLFPSRTS